MGKTFYVTTPIYYVNDVPHIGHAYTTIAADALARYRRLNGDEVFFLTGTDEHGRKIEDAAKNAGEKPIELADKVVIRFKKLWELLGITNDDFIRTTEPRHMVAVQEIFRRIEERGDIYLGEYEGWYNVREEAFITDTQYKELMELPESKRPLIERVKEESYFFKLSKYAAPLLKFYADNPDFIEPKNRRNEVVRFVEGGLRDLSISRTTFSWGIPVPDNDRHVLYVWFDALTNYITAGGFPDDADRFSEIWPADIHIVGKDILRFHTVYWPAFLMSAELPLPKKVFAHGWWTVEGEKMSKTLGNVVDPYAVVDEFSADILRYFLLREIPFGQDGDFSKSALIGRINGDLANTLGNLVSRSLGMCEQYTEGRAPKPGSHTEKEIAVKDAATKAVRNIAESMDGIAFNKALIALWEFLSDVNKYVDETAPWTLHKEGNTERLHTVLYTLTESLRITAILSFPFIPDTATEIWSRLGFETDLAQEDFSNAKTWGLISPGVKVVKGVNLFTKVSL